MRYQRDVRSFFAVGVNNCAHTRAFTRTLSSSLTPQPISSFAHSPTKPWETSHVWAARVLKEFFVQGDREVCLPTFHPASTHTTHTTVSALGNLLTCPTRGTSCTHAWYLMHSCMVPHALMHGTSCTHAWYFMHSCVVPHALMRGTSCTHAWYLMHSCMVPHALMHGTSCTHAWYRHARATAYSVVVFAVTALFVTALLSRRLLSRHLL
jgi:hypothetical protein